MKVLERARTSVGCRTLLAAMAVALAAGLGCGSHAIAGPAPVDLTVVDRETGRELTVWRHHGRAFVAGEPGARYGLRLANHTGDRVLLVLSVDGVNVLTGETAKYDQRGYVLNAYEGYDVNGWRKSRSEVAAFTFTPSPRSYAARTGRPDDVGVIGMAVFTERPPPPQPAYAPRAGRGERPTGGRGDPSPPPLPLPPVKAPIAEAADGARSLARAAPSFEAPSSVEPPLRREALGTGHGEREWSSITRTTFVRATAYPQSLRRIEYDTYANLAARGVIPGPCCGEHRPRPFPREPDRAGFVPDPPGER